MSTDDQIHRAAIKGPRSPMVPAVVGALIGGAVTFVVMHFAAPPPAPPAPPPSAPVVAAAPVPCTPTAEAAPPKEPPKKSGRLASLIGRLGGGGSAEPAPERRATQELDREALGRFIRERLPSIRVCYDRELKLNPSLKGKIVVRFDVTPGGRVANGGIESDTMRDDAVSRCILTLMRGWSMPFRPSENTTVSFPFVFQPG